MKRGAVREPKDEVWGSTFQNESSDDCFLLAWIICNKITNSHGYEHKYVL